MTASEHSFLSLSPEQQTELLDKNPVLATALDTAVKGLVGTTISKVNNTITTSETSQQSPEELTRVRALTDAPWCFYDADIVAAAGIKTITSWKLSETEPQCAEDPKQPWNWHYNQAGTLALEAYLQAKYPTEKIRLSTMSETESDISMNKWKAVGCRDADYGVVYYRGFSYFRISGGVDYVCQLSDGYVDSFRAHPAYGLSVRFRHG